MNVAEGSVRASKSVSVNMRFLRFMTKDAPKKGNFLFAGYSNNTVRRNVIQPLQELVGTDLKYFHSPEPHCRLWGRKIDVLGFKDISSVAKCQGSEWSGSILDELTRFNQEGYKMLQSRFSVEGAKQFISLNPDSPYHWVKTDVLDNPKLDLFKMHYTLDDNPFLPEAYVRNLKATYSGVFYDRYIRGLWVMAEGVIYDFFIDDYPFVITDEQTPKPDYYTIGVDYGIKNPTAFGLNGHRRSELGQLKAWLHREYYYDGRKEVRTKTDSEFVDDLINFIEEHVKGVFLKGFYIDPSASSLISEIENRRVRGEHRLPPVLETDNTVIDGIRTVSQMWKNGLYAVNESCTNTRKEAMSYLWDEKAQLKGEDKPMKEHDHCMDGCLRYPLHSEYGDYQIDYEAFTRW